MKLKWVKIKNYRSCKELEIDFQNMHAFVGANNSGKTSILKGLDFLFNPSTTKIDDECFWNKDTGLTIWIEAIFDELTDSEVSQLTGYLKSNNTFHIARSVNISSESDNLGTEPEEENKCKISQQYCIPMPSQIWLRENEVNGNNINEWWENQDELKVNGMSFVDFVGGTKPRVGEWKEKIPEFIASHLTETDFVEVWNDNPKGYAGVLKGTLPNFIYIPAVKDLSDETKVTKSNPFGRLLYRIMENISSEQRESINSYLENIKKKLNKDGGDERLNSISETENKLNSILNSYMEAELEIEFETPQVEVLLSTPKIFIDDGFRNIAQNKGHGLQRAVIFSILRLYSELFTARDNQRIKSTIFAIEEPEIYMHPQAQRNIRKVFLDISSGIDQVFFATHSSLLLDVTNFDEIIRLEATKTIVGNKTSIETKKWQLPVSNLIHDFENRHPTLRNNVTAHSIRELYSNAYHPTRSEGFFANKVILVEGATEQYSLPIYADALNINLDLLNISIVDSGGKGSMDRLFRVFNELGIPCYIIIDYDKDNQDTEIISKSRELLEMVNENTDVPTSIVAQNKIACFPTKWETDLESEIPNYANLVSNARSTLGRDVGKPLIARFIARKLVSQSPAFIPPSIKNILEKAVAVNWENSCLTT
jgi:putative ATP-dependent endonuclease of OLD family